jgi:hypothetical protein
MSRKRPVDITTDTKSNKKVKNDLLYFSKACDILRTCLRGHKWHPDFSLWRIETKDQKEIRENVNLCIRINSANAFSYFILAKLTSNSEQSKNYYLKFLNFVDHSTVRVDEILWPKDINIMKANAHFRVAFHFSVKKPMTPNDRKQARKHFEACLCFKPDANCRDLYAKFLKKTDSGSEATKIISGKKSLKKHFTLSGSNIRDICHRFGLLTPGFQNYVKTIYVDTYFAMKEFVGNEKQWLVTFVHPFCEEEFPISVTEAILAFTYPL